MQFLSLLRGLSPVWYLKNVWTTGTKTQRPSDLIRKRELLSYVFCRRPIVLPEVRLEFCNRRGGGGSWVKKQRTHSKDSRIKGTRISSFIVLGPLLTAKAANRVAWLKRFLLSFDIRRTQARQQKAGRRLGPLRLVCAKGPWN